MKHSLVPYSQRKEVAIFGGQLTGPLLPPPEPVCDAAHRAAILPEPASGKGRRRSGSGKVLNFTRGFAGVPPDTFSGVPVPPGTGLVGPGQIPPEPPSMQQTDR